MATQDEVDRFIRWLETEIVGKPFAEWGVSEMMLRQQVIRRKRLIREQTL